MKSALALLLPVAAAIAAAVAPLEIDTQTYFGSGSLSYSDYDIDLQELRLVQFENESPRWMTELDKVRPPGNCNFASRFQYHTHHLRSRPKPRALGSSTCKEGLVVPRKPLQLLTERNLFHQNRDSGPRQLRSVESRKQAYVMVKCTDPHLIL